MKRALDIGIMALCLVCGVIFILRNAEAKTLFPASSSLEAPTWNEGLLQRPDMEQTTGAAFLCRHDCRSTTDWPTTSDPVQWLRSVNQHLASAGAGDRPDAPSLIRHEGRWIILWGERSDRLEVVVQGQGAGVWPRSRFAQLYGATWWGPLK